MYSNFSEYAVFLKNINFADVHIDDEEYESGNDGKYERAVRHEAFKGGCGQSSAGYVITVHG